MEPKDEKLEALRKEIEKHGYVDKEYKHPIYNSPSVEAIFNQIAGTKASGIIHTYMEPREISTTVVPGNFVIPNAVNSDGTITEVSIDLKTEYYFWDEQVSGPFKLTSEHKESLKAVNLDVEDVKKNNLFTEYIVDITNTGVRKIIELAEKNYAEIEAVDGKGFWPTSIEVPEPKHPSEIRPKFRENPWGWFSWLWKPKFKYAPDPAKNLATRQRRLLSRIIAASNLISIRGRQGPATAVIVNGQLATALQDISGFVVAQQSREVQQINGCLYPVGIVAGMTVYCDPYMKWDDLRVIVYRKGRADQPGLNLGYKEDSIEMNDDLIKGDMKIYSVGENTHRNYFIFEIEMPEGGII